MVNTTHTTPEQDCAYLLLEEAKEEYGVPLNTLRAWVRLQKVRSIKLRGRVLVCDADLEEMSRLYVPKLTRRKPKKAC